MFEKLEIPKELWPKDPRFGVGPSLIPTESLEALLKTGMKYLGTSHRQTAVVSVIKELQEGLRKYFSLPAGHQVLIGNGGATFLFDMMGLGLVEKKSAHFTMGEFSHKWFLAHNKIPWITAKEFATPYGEAKNPPKVEGFDFVATTLNETSTGVMLTELPDYTETETLLAVDATSGAGQIKCDISKTDFYFFSPQKVFASEGGLYIAFISEKAIKRARKILQDDSRYIPESMNFENAITNSLKNQTYNTPSLTSIFFLNEQVKRMNKLGQDKIIQLANEKAKSVYDWAENHPMLSCYIKEAHFRSNAVATIDVDPKYNVTEITGKLRELGIAYDIDSYRKLGRNQFRLGMFHNIGSEDLTKLTQVIDFVLNHN